MPVFYPLNDEELLAFVDVTIAALPGVMLQLTLPGTFDDALIAKRATFATRLTTHQGSQVQAVQDRVSKDVGKDDLVIELQNINSALRGNLGFTDVMAADLGFPVYDTQPTPIVAGEEVPTLLVDVNTPQQHRISFWQMTDLEGGRIAKPEWAQACHIRYAIVASGAAAPPIEDMLYLASDSNDPYVWIIPGEHVGKDIWYRGAWETPRHELGGYSDPAKGTVRG